MRALIICAEPDVARNQPDSVASVLSDLGYQMSGGDTGPIGMLAMVLNLATIVVGLLIRSGRAWILAINVVAIALFLELTALPTTFAIIFSTLDAIVLFALFRHRPWFDWDPEAEAAASRDGRP